MLNEKYIECLGVKCCTTCTCNIFLSAYTMFSMQIVKSSSHDEVEFVQHWNILIIIIASIVVVIMMQHKSQFQSPATVQEKFPSCVRGVCRIPKQNLLLSASKQTHSGYHGLFIHT